MRIRVGTEWDAPSISGSVREKLHVLAPRSEVFTWLHLYWEPGDPWCPVERWVIAEMQPYGPLAMQRDLFKLLGDETGSHILDELEGPNPRTGTYWDHTLGRLVRPSHVLAPSITRRQWVLFQEFRALATPMWIVQGAGGGHKRRFNAVEKATLAMAGRPTDPPAPGDAPYAAPDNRTIGALREMDQMRRWNQSFVASWDSRTDEARTQARVEHEAQFRERLLKWVDQQMLDASDDLARVASLADMTYDPGPSDEERAALHEALYRTESVALNPR